MKTNRQIPSFKSVLSLGVLLAGWSVPSVLQAQVFGIDPTKVVNAGQNAGTYGFTFTTDAQLAVTQLGAFDFGAYSSGSASIELWKTGDSSSLAAASVNLDGGTTNPDSWVFRYAQISRVTLEPGVEYALVWHDNSGESSQPLSIPTALTGLPNTGITITHTFNHSGIGLSGSPLADGDSIGASTPSDLQIKGSVDMIATVHLPESEYAIPGMAGVAILLHVYRLRRRKANLATHSTPVL